MSARLSLSKLVFKISHQEFLSLVTAFKKASEQAFGTEAAVKIGVYNAPKVYTTFADDDIAEVLRVENEQRHVLTTQSLADISKGVWDSAGYAQVILKPANPDIAPDYAFSNVEFLGNRPKQATFYIQGGSDRLCETVMTSMKNQFKFMVRGDGYTSNGSRSNFMPSGMPYIPGSRFIPISTRLK